jgi:hypothetical protein
MRKTASNVDLRLGAVIDENAGNVRVAMPGPVADRRPEIAWSPSRRAGMNVGG